MDEPYNFKIIKGRICGEPLKLAKCKHVLETMYVRRKKFEDYMPDGIVAKSAILLLYFYRSYIRGESSCS